MHKRLGLLISSSISWNSGTPPFLVLHPGYFYKYRRGYYYAQTQEKYLLRKARLCPVCRRRFCGTGKHMEISISGSKIWRRNLSARLYHPCTDLRLLHHHRRDLTRTHDKEKSGRCISEFWKIKSSIIWRMDQCNHSDSDCAVLFRHWRMGYQIPV